MAAGCHSHPSTHSDVEARRLRGGEPPLNPRRLSWGIGLVMVGTACTYFLWPSVTHTESYQLFLRLYEDKHFLKQTLRSWGALAPLFFILIQALQVIIAPIPGDITGLLGGFVFGEWLGFFYSTLGLTVGSLFAFLVGRWLGVHFAMKLVSQQVWEQMGFILEAEGAALCFIIFLIPGLPKDTVCYLFGMSPMPFWVFAVVSTLGRMPGTWVLSAQGARAATGEYIQLILLTTIMLAAALPLYYYRVRIVAWFRDVRERTGLR